MGIIKKMIMHVRCLKRRHRLSCKGVTLVELMVVFALTSILLLAAVQAMTSALASFGRMQSLTHAITVCDTVMDKIEGELSDAMADDGRLDIGTVDGKNAVSFYTGDGSPVYITTTSQAQDFGETVPQDSSAPYLLMHYYKEGAGEAIDWSFDPKIYQGFYVSELGFEQNGKTNIVRVTLTLKNGKVSYSETRYICCANFTSKIQLKEIHSNVAISPDDPEYKSVASD